jgi:hypothetical protein
MKTSSWSIGAAALWLLLLAGIVTAAGWFEDVGDLLIRATVDLALAYYAVAVGLMTGATRDDWRSRTPRGRLMRSCWNLGWAAYVIHVAVAFHFMHHWSHFAAYGHVERVSGFGPGIFVSYFFTLLWTVDVSWWNANAERYAARPAWIGWLVHGTVVYETGPIRYVGVAGFGVLALQSLYRSRSSARLGRVE